MARPAPPARLRRWAAAAAGVPEVGHRQDRRHEEQEDVGDVDQAEQRIGYPLAQVEDGKEHRHRPAEDERGQFQRQHVEADRRAAGVRDEAREASRPSL